MGVPVRHGKLADSIREVLSKDRWQTTSLISAQIQIPPDAIAREMIRRNTTAKITEGGIKSGFVAHTLSKMKDVERRKNERGKYEYRLADTVCEQPQQQQQAPSNRPTGATQFVRNQLEINGVIHRKDLRHIKNLRRILQYMSQRGEIQTCGKGTWTKKQVDRVSGAVVD